MPFFSKNSQASTISLQKTMGKVSPILVTLTSQSDSDFERSNHSLKENKPDGVDPNSKDLHYYVRKNNGKILWFSADCYVTFCLSETVPVSAYLHPVWYLELHVNTFWPHLFV